MTNITSGTVIAGSSLYRTLAITHIEDSWAHSLMKEIWQNTIDLPSVSKLDITIEQESSDIATITFVDDGSGMSLSTLTDIYLVYGETTKAKDDSKVGGYGLGRVTCTFGAYSYSIHSQDWLCEGEGERYTIRTNMPYFKGFKLKVRFPSINRTGDSRLAIRGINKYLKYCYSTRINVTINGEKWNNWLVKGKYIASLSFCQAYESSSYNCHIVAENEHGDGLYLSEKYIYTRVKSGVVITIPAGLTKKVMNISRTQFESSYDKELDNFIKDTLRVHEPRVELIYEDRGEYKPFNQRNDKQRSAALTHIFDKMNPLLIRQLVSQLIDDRSTTDNSYMTQQDLSIAWEGTEDEVDGLRQQMEDNKTYINLFMNITSIVLEWGIHILEKSDVKHWSEGWKAGIYLGKFETKGMCIHKGSYVTIYLSPFAHTPNNREIYIDDLIATVLHEVAHIVEKSHDSDYATVLTKLLAMGIGTGYHLMEELSALNVPVRSIYNPSRSSSISVDKSNEYPSSLLLDDDMIPSPFYSLEEAEELFI